MRVFPFTDASSEGGGQKEKDSFLRTHFPSRSGTRATDRVDFESGAESLAAAGKRIPTRPSARFVPAAKDDAATVGDEDWSWRVLPPVPVSFLKKEGAFDADGSRARVREPAPPSGARKEFRDGNVSAGEDLGAAVPRRVRGVGAKLDRGEARTSTGGDTGASAVRVPSYSRATFASGLGIVTNPTVTNASGYRGAASAAAPEDETETETQKAKEKDETPSFDFASLASGLAPATGDAAGPAVERAAGGKKRRRPGASKPAEPPPPATAEKKKNKKNKKTDPKSAVEAAMRLLLGE